MTWTETVREALAVWAGRLAGRLSELHDRVREAVIDAVGRTAAEAAEAALRGAFRERALTGRTHDVSHDPDDPWGDAHDWDVVERAPAGRPMAWPWRTTVAAALCVLAPWLGGHAANPLATAVAAVAAAALWLFD